MPCADAARRERRRDGARPLLDLRIGEIAAGAGERQLLGVGARRSGEDLGEHLVAQEIGPCLAAQDAHQRRGIGHAFGDLPPTHCVHHRLFKPALPGEYARSLQFDMVSGMADKTIQRNSLDAHGACKRERSAAPAADAPFAPAVAPSASVTRPLAWLPINLS